MISKRLYTFCHLLTAKGIFVQAKKHCHSSEQAYNNSNGVQECDGTFINEFMLLLHYTNLIRIMFTVGTVDVMSTEYRPSIGRYFVDAPRPNIGHMSAVYQSTVGDMSVNCRWHIGQLSVAYQSYVICIGKLLADTSVKYRSSIGQLSAKCRPSVGQVSARYR